MPRQVDHDERRRELAAALWRVVVAHGAGQASVRSVAAESGWSAGALRHYFTSQQELRTFAIQLMAEQTIERVGAVLNDSELSTMDRAAALVEQLLPVDDTRRAECLVWYAFADRARFDPAQAGIRAFGWQGTRYVARVVVADLSRTARPEYRSTDAVIASLEPASLEAIAVRLHVMIDGWAIQGIGFPDVMTAACLRDQVRAELVNIERLVAP